MAADTRESKAGITSTSPDPQEVCHGLIHSMVVLSHEHLDVTGIQSH